MSSTDQKGYVRRSANDSVGRGTTVFEYNLAKGGHKGRTVYYVRKRHFLTWCKHPIRIQWIIFKSLWNIIANWKAQISKIWYKGTPEDQINVIFWSITISTSCMNLQGKILKSMTKWVMTGFKSKKYWFCGVTYLKQVPKSSSSWDHKSKWKHVGIFIWNKKYLTVS